MVVAGAADAEFDDGIGHGLAAGFFTGEGLEAFPIEGEFGFFDAWHGLGKVVIWFSGSI